MLKSALLILSLSLSACAAVPQPPRHVQYGSYPQVEPPGFYGVDSITKERVYRSFFDPEMRGAQCLSASDFKSMQTYIEQLIQLAKQRCQ